MYFVMCLNIHKILGACVGLKTVALVCVCVFMCLERRVYEADIIAPTCPCP